MKPLKLHTWGVINQSGDHFLNPLEHDLRDLCIVGKHDVQILKKTFTYVVETSPIANVWQGVFQGQQGFFIQTVNRDVFELVGEPNKDYSRLFRLDRAKFAEVVTKKLKLF